MRLHGCSEFADVFVVRVILLFVDLFFACFTTWFNFFHGFQLFLVTVTIANSFKFHPRFLLCVVVVFLFRHVFKVMSNDGFKVVFEIL